MIYPFLRRALFFCFTLLVIAFIAGFHAASAQSSPTPESLRVGVVIKTQGGGVNTFCVALSPDKATGLDALRATGVDLNIQAGPLGAAVCRVENVGCSAPAETCFCKCQGAECGYWVYYYYDEAGNWKYSQQGTAARTLNNGAVEGWLWNESSGLTPIGGLPVVRFSDLCPANGTATPLPAASNTDSAAGSSTGRVLGYLLFGALVIVIGVVAVAQRHKGQPTR